MVGRKHHLMKSSINNSEERQSQKSEEVGLSRNPSGEKLN